MSVEYRTLPGFDGYRFGSDGSVWTCWYVRGKGGRNGTVAIKTGRWKRLTGSVNQDGYLRVKIKHLTEGRRVRLIHQLILFAFHGPRPAGMQSCHNNGNCIDNRATNLRWDTQSANQLDAVKHGTKKTGLTKVGATFIAKWNASPSLSAFCEATGKSRRKAIALAYSYRAQGHIVKTFPKMHPVTAVPGEKFGKWTVLEIRGPQRRLCRCDCGAEREVFAPSLTSGVSTSCSCSRRRGA